MKIRHPFLLLTTVVTSMPIIFGTAAAASQLPINEYIPYHPTGCRFVRKNPDGRFSFVQTCSRGPAGEWEQVVDALVLATPGVIYIPRQTLINGLDIEGYWCSGAAPRAFKEQFQGCTKLGWQKTSTTP